MGKAGVKRCLICRQDGAKPHWLSSTLKAWKPTELRLIHLKKQKKREVIVHFAL
jgi:hypothetical protein